MRLHEIFNPGLLKGAKCSEVTVSDGCVCEQHYRMVVTDVLGTR
jgi:hypothetical protein